jgi:U4/U6.U5 tri-snRNP component SNU23
MGSSIYKGATAGDTNFRRKFTTVSSQSNASASSTSIESKNKKQKINSDEPILLQARDDLDSHLEVNVNKTTVVEGATASKQPGFYCDVCDVTLKDSSSYLDHVNGRGHLRNLGLSTRVAKSTVEQVKERIQFWKRKLETEPEGKVER